MIPKFSFGTTMKLTLVVLNKMSKPKILHNMQTLSIKLKESADLHSNLLWVQ